MSKTSAMEYLGGLTFPAQEYDLASIPNNERAAQDAAAMMPYIRMAALLLHESDEELEAKVRSSDIGEHMDLLEGIGAALDAKQQDAGMLEAGFTRLLVVIERVLGEKTVRAAYREPDKKIDKRAHLAGIRARLHRGTRPFKPHLVTGGRT